MTNDDDSPQQKGLPVSAPSESTVTALRSIFLHNMGPEERKLFNRASPGIELSEELKLIRTVLATLTDDVNANAKRIADALIVLLRAAAQQHRQNEGSFDLQAILEEIGENTVRVKQAKNEEVKQLALPLTPLAPDPSPSRGEGDADDREGETADQQEVSG